MAKRLRIINREQCIGCFSCMFACARTWKGVLSLEKAALRVKTYSGVEGAFSIRACYACKNPDCASACPTGALSPREGGGVVFTKEKCINCKKCYFACVPRALQWDSEALEPIECKQCGICVQYCPNNVLEMVEIGDLGEEGERK